MAVIFKYIFYAFIIVIIYFLGISFYDGAFNKDSNLKEVTQQVTSNAADMINEDYQRTKNTLQDKINKVISESEETIENGTDQIESETQEIMHNGFKE